MSTNASLYQPKDNSLFERIQGYRSTLKALQQIERSRQVSNDKKWSQTLGEDKELESAFTVCRESLNEAIRNIEPNEMQQAIQDGLIDGTEARDYKHAQRKIRFKQLHDQNRDTRSKGSDFERD